MIFQGNVRWEEGFLQSGGGLLVDRCTDTFEVNQQEGFSWIKKKGSDKMFTSVNACLLLPMQLYISYL